MAADNVSGLLDALYEAAGNQDRWANFFSHLAAIVPFTVATFSFFNAQNRTYEFQVTEGIPTDAQDLYNLHYGALDEWYLRARSVVREGWVNDGRSLCSNTDLVRTEFYNDFLQRFGWLHECAAVIEMREFSMSVLTMMRDSHGSEFSSEEIDAIRTIAPHLKRALKLHRRIVDLQFCKEAESWVLDRVPFGVVLLNSSGTVLLANNTARKMATNGMIRLSESGLHAISCREDAQLQAAIRCAAAPVAAVSGTGALLLNGFDDRAIAAVVTPVKSTMFGMVPAVAVFLTDNGARHVSRTQILKTLFELTAAETRLAERLADGTPLKEAADHLGITVSTARTQLKNVFQKTNTSRQAELVRLLLMLPVDLGAADQR
jgi:DNA-binding CsgD family transcriptional regulator